jgi:hypothetical protein
MGLKRLTPPLEEYTNRRGGRRRHARNARRLPERFRPDFRQTLHALTGQPRNLSILDAVRDLACFVAPRAIHLCGLAHEISLVLYRGLNAPDVQLSLSRIHVQRNLSTRGKCF